MCNIVACRHVPVALGAHRVNKYRMGAELTIATDVLLQIPNFRHRWVLATGSQQVAQVIEGNATVSALVEQRESLLVVGRSLSIVIVRSHVVCFSLRPIVM